MHYSVSATTRPARTGEINGVNYHFVSCESFQQMLSRDELLEWAQVYGQYYGTPRRYVDEKLQNGQDVVLEIDVQGAMKIKEKFPQGVFIFIVPPSLAELSVRINKRGSDTPESILKRLGCAKTELSLAGSYNYIIVNDEVARAVNKIRSIVTAEKCRTVRNQDILDKICNDQ